MDNAAVTAQAVRVAVIADDLTGAGRGEIVAARDAGISAFETRLKGGVLLGRYRPY